MFTRALTAALVGLLVWSIELAAPFSHESGMAIDSNRAGAQARRNDVQMMSSPDAIAPAQGPNLTPRSWLPAASSRGPYKSRFTTQPLSPLGNRTREIWWPPAGGGYTMDVIRTSDATWIATTAGLFEVAADGDRGYSAIEGQTWSFMTLALDAEGRIWAGLESTSQWYSGGVAVQDDGQLTLEWLPGDIDMPLGSVSEVTSDDATGTIWFTAHGRNSGGLYSIASDGTRTVDTSFADMAGDWPLTVLFSDDSGNLWLAGDDRVMTRSPDGQWSRLVDPIGNASVGTMAIAPDRARIGIANEEALFMRDSDTTWVRYDMPEWIDLWPHAMAIASDGSTWFASESGNWMRDADGSWLRFEDDDILADYYDDVVADSAGDIWYLSHKAVRIMPYSGK